MAKKVYLSVCDFDGILDSARVLKNEFGYEVVSSGFTLEQLRNNGVEAIDIVDLAIEQAIQEKASLDVFVRKHFDMVVVKLPSVKHIAEKTDDIKMFMNELNVFDFSILRASAKNFEKVTAVCEMEDLLEAVNSDDYFRQALALKAFRYMADYDLAISETIGVYSGEDERKFLNMEKIYDLKYGSNPHQNASLFRADEMADYKVLNEKYLSHNDILNITTAANVISEFFDVNAVAVVKHNLPCGVALGRDLYDAYTKAFDCDPFSTFSGTVACSQEVTLDVARHLASTSAKVIVAPDYEEAAVEALKNNPYLKIVQITTPLRAFKNIMTEEIKNTPFGTLVQDKNTSELTAESFKVVTKAKPTTEQLEDAIFAWKIAKYSRTSSAVVAKDFKTVAITQGNTNVVSATELALDVACENSKDAVLATDEAIPTGDCINAAVQARISLIIQPGGTRNDKSVIELADAYGVAMIMTGIRNLKF